MKPKIATIGEYYDNFEMDGFEVPGVFYFNPDMPNILTCNSHE